MDDDKKERTDDIRASRPRLEKLRPDTPALKQPQQLRQQVTAGKKETLRHTGIDILGDVRWGTHFCLFYHIKEDLIDILVPYFKAGLDNNEFCMWVTSEPLNAEDAKQALKHAVRNLDAYLRKGQIEILDYSDWYTKSGAFEADSVLQGWIQKHDQAITNGFDGLRLTGNTFWLEKKDWVKFTDYEAVVNNVIGKYKMLAICTYSLDKCGASEILDVEHNHQFALIKWRGDWKILESSSKNQLEARLAEQTAIAQALERSKKDWVKTFNAMSDWVAFIDLKGRILRTNRAGENFTGKPIAEIIGQSCCKLVHGSEEHIPGCPLRIMLHTRQRATAELQVPSTNRWLMVTTDPVIDKKGNLIGAVHVTRDISERKKAEEALWESEERFQQVAENTQEWIWEVDANGLYTYASLIVEKILDYKPEEIVGKKHFYDLFHPEDKEELKKEAFETFAKKESFRGFINRNVHKNGETVWLSTSGVPVLDEKGILLGYRGADADITERKQAEEALTSERDKLKSLMEGLVSTGIGIDIIGIDHKVLFQNQLLKERFGDLTGKLCYENYMGLKKPCGNCPMMRAIKNNKVERVELVAANGRDHEVISAPLLNPDGTVDRAIEVIVDISERKRAEEALRGSRDYLERLTNSMWDAVFSVKMPERVIEWGNDSFRLTGYEPQNCIGRTTEFLYPDKREFIDFGNKLRKVIKAGEDVLHAEQILRRKNGETFPAEITTTLFREKGKVVRVTSIVRDITERKRAEERLLDYQGQLKSLASQLTLTEERERRRIAADLHDHVSQSLSFSKMKLEAIRIAESSAETERVLAEVSDLLGQTIDDTRSLTFDLSSPILYELGFEAAVADWLTEQIERKHNIKTEFKDDRQPKPLDDDIRVLLFRNVKELLINVIKHAHTGKVKVSIRKAGTQIRISVEDDGVGFDPAETMSMAARRAEFGLFSIRERLEELGGYLEIDSAPGRGCRVTMTTPLKNAKK